MKAIEEIGIKKTFSFAAFSVIEIIYFLMIFPPFRKIFLQVFGTEIGKNSVIMNVKFFNWYHLGLKGLKVGKECFIGDDVLIDLYDQVILEDQVTIAQRVNILTHLNVGYRNHPLQKFFPKFSKPVVFKRGSVVGVASTILPGVVVGEESFIGAGSVVTKDVPKRTLVAGVPAKIVRKIK